MVFLSNLRKIITYLGIFVYTNGFGLSGAEKFSYVSEFIEDDYTYSLNPEYGHLTGDVKACLQIFISLKIIFTFRLIFNFLYFMYLTKILHNTFRLF